MASSTQRGPVLLAAVVAGAFAAALILANLAAAPVPDVPVEGGYVSRYRPADEAMDVILNQGDGQAYAALAADPLLRHPEVFDEGAPAAAFFAQRPLLNYLAWALALGRPSATPIGLALAMVVSAAVLASGAVALAQVRGAGQRAPLAGLVLLLPGSLAMLDWFEPGMLGLGLVLWGLVAWERRPDQRALAGLAFAGAVLCRESMALVPLLLGLEALVARRLRWRDAAALAAGPLAYVGWQVVVRARYGTGPEQVAGNASFDAPLQGLADAVGGWGAAEVVVAVLGVVLLGLAVRRRPGDLLTHAAGLYAASGLVLHGDVWRAWEGFGRVLLPMYALSVLALLSDPGSPSARSAVGSPAQAVRGRGLPFAADDR